MPENVGNPLFETVNSTILGAFGEPAKFSWTPNTGDIVDDLDGIFDARHFAVESEGEVSVSDYQPSLACERADVSYGEAGGIAEGDQVTVRGTAYVVKDMRPDSEGWLILDLRRP